MMRFNSKATPVLLTLAIAGCYIKVVNLFNQSYGVHIMPHHAILVIVALGVDAHTHKIRTHAY